VDDGDGVIDGHSDSAFLRNVNVALMITKSR
jgi:hypothetical protein